MKTTATTLLCLLLIFSGHSQKTSFTDKKNEPINQHWLQQAQKTIQESEYAFRQNSQSCHFFASNPAQKLGFKINPIGYSVSPMSSDKEQGIADWQAEFMLLGINKGKEFLIPNREYSFEKNNSSLSFNYPSFSVEYSNNENGMRQNFILNKKMKGQEEVELLLKYKGTLSASVQQNELQLKDEKNALRLFYKDLKVWDANQQPLVARMEMRDNNILAIVVNDQNAVYPITIDPINQTPEWSGVIEGIIPSLVGQLAVDAAYGYTVASLGDVNGDTYDDVAIGAPAMSDVINGSGTLLSVGAVFVYFGSQNGLPAAPSVSLQPTTAIAGAMFGYSIAGGDVNGDGINDIVIGAPVDNIVVNSTNGKIGKVYVYDGATLTTNTTPFLHVTLSGNSIIKDGINLSVNALFGFSVAVTEDQNGDGKKDILVGSPTYAGIKNDILGNPTLLDVRSGGAFLFLTHQSDNNLDIVKLEPIKSNLLGLISSNIDGLLFGYSVDGLGDYNGDGRPDIVATAPAGIDVSPLSILLNNKLLQGSAIVYYGNGAGVNKNPGAVLTATSHGLLTSITGSLANIADLFGTSVKGVKNASGARTGSVLVGAPLGGVLVNVLSLQLKTGTVSVFIKKASSPVSTVNPDQVLSSPRNNSTILGVIQSNLLFGYSIDNTLDLNCDGIGDIIVGEPASSAAQLINANVAGGAAYVYLGKPNGTYIASPNWSMTANADAFLGINATSLIGFSVAGVGKIHGPGNDNYILAGSPSRTLDFGVGLLNLGNTFGTLFGLVAGNNGVGKSFLFKGNLCSVLPVKSTPLKGAYANGTSYLSWSTLQENGSGSFEIQRSTDAVNFNNIGSVSAKGTSNTESKYSFNDIKVNDGNNYYRLKIIDRDGHFEYSNVVLLKVKIEGISITSTYPNPFADKVNVVLQSSIAGEAQIQLFDSKGSCVFVYKTKIMKGLNNIVIENLERLSKGVYNMKLICSGKTISYKLLK